MAVASNPEDPTKPKDGKPGEKILPLDYMLQVINDPEEKDKNRKDRLAIAAAPYCHPRKGEGAGKKEEKADRAAKAGGGKFAAGTPPKLAVVNK
jgi:phage terminase small subunit